MMRLPPFTYLAPVSVADAVKLMADHGPEAMLVAGGTDLYPNMKRRQFEPQRQQVLRIEPGINLLQASEAANHQARADEQYQPQSNFRHHQQVTPQAQ